ncbi:MAG: hypothetical protein AB7F22_29860 [Reyranella sp.]|uniref:hypothetical protein n=1 Tax=Reyranella sp. TaxID=1929291 RepID=UPI003D0A137D
MRQKRVHDDVDIVAESRERVDLLLENYLLALACVDQCSESAPETVRTRLALNLERAERLYADAAADGLAGEKRDIEAIHAALAKVNASTRAGLRDGWIIAELVTDLELATLHARRLFEAACHQTG